MFGDLETFHNCLIYPAVAQLYGNGSLGDSQLADSLGIHNQTQAMQTANNITTTINSCLSKYCGEDERCTSDLQRLGAFGYASSNVSSSTYLTDPDIFRFDICNYVAPFAFLNADIGGVGVSTNPV